MSEEHFTPQMSVHYLLSQRGLTVEDLDLAPTVVVTWGAAMCRALAEEIGAREPACWLYPGRYPCYVGQVDGQRVSILLAPVGAPGTVMLMEELIACGARTFIGLGWAGSLQTTAPVGALLLPTGCIREEGTSFHYLDADAELAPAGPLAERLLASGRAEGAAPLAGPLWTTDAPYRELQSQVVQYRQQGVLGVDMETSAMYALGQYRGVAVCNLLVVSDELWGEWRPAFGAAELEQANGLARRVVVNCLAGWVY